MSLLGCSNGTPLSVVRATDRITDRDARAMVKAIDTQVRRDFTKPHGLINRRVRYTTPDKLTATDWVITLVDDAGQDALGWHTEDTGDIVYGVVGVNPVLDHDGRVLEGPLSVASVLSHEVLELLLNPSISLWADTGAGYLVAREAADAVQSDWYEIDGVSVSNFLLPDWFSPAVSPDDRYDHMGLCRAPFEVRPGGYTLKCQGGRITEVYGETPPPEWLMERKRHRATARTHRLTHSQPT